MITTFDIVCKNEKFKIQVEHGVGFSFERIQNKINQSLKACVIAGCGKTLTLQHVKSNLGFMFQGDAF